MFSRSHGFENSHREAFNRGRIDHNVTQRINLWHVSSESSKNDTLLETKLDDLRAKLAFEGSVADDKERHILLAARNPSQPLGEMLCDLFPG